VSVQNVTIGNVTTLDFTSAEGVIGEVLNATCVVIANPQGKTSQTFSIAVMGQDPFVYSAEINSSLPILSSSIPPQGLNFFSQNGSVLALP